VRRALPLARRGPQGSAHLAVCANFSVASRDGAAERAAALLLALRLPHPAFSVNILHFSYLRWENLHVLTWEKLLCYYTAGMQPSSLPSTACMCHMEEALYPEEECFCCLVGIYSVSVRLSLPSLHTTLAPAFHTLPRYIPVLQPRGAYVLTLLVHAIACLPASLSACLLPPWPLSSIFFHGSWLPRL